MNLINCIGCEVNQIFGEKSSTSSATERRSFVKYLLIKRLHIFSSTCLAFNMELILCNSKKRALGIFLCVKQGEIYKFLFICIRTKRLNHIFPYGVFFILTLDEENVYFEHVSLHFCLTLTLFYSLSHTPSRLGTKSLRSTERPRGT